MEKLIDIWRRRAIKYRELERKTNNNAKAEGFLASAETYDLCISELKLLLK